MDKTYLTCPACGTECEMRAIAPSDKTKELMVTCPECGKSGVIIVDRVKWNRKGD